MFSRRGAASVTHGIPMLTLCLPLEIPYRYQ